MSHSEIFRSPEGTALIDRTVGEIVADRPGRSRVFQRHSIDFCCQGGRTLRDACARRELDPDAIVDELEAEPHSTRAEPGENPATLPLDALAEYIVERHHNFLREELPRLHAMADRVGRVHGGHTPSLVEVYNVFTDMAQELAQHVMKEENVLFPAIIAMVREKRATLPLDGPIACMMKEHDDAGQALERLRELTASYTPPESACNTYRALFSGLVDFDRDLQTHIHLENSVLFPGARRLVEDLP